MKKNISINISGIIFHIEEDGYELLKNYLEAITRYFSSYEERSEIIADIESRIAEIFLTRLSTQKQVITAVDVEGLIATMGTVQDFAAVEDDMDQSLGHGQNTHSHQQAHSGPAEEQPYGTKRLYRDTSHKVLGGVAAGMANYFNVDPLWMRLLFLFLGFSSFIFWFDFGTFSSTAVIAYIILWILLPASDRLEENKQVKKLYRNPDDKVIGGVSSGIAAYFGTDVTLIRVLFVLTAFVGGSGFIIYIVLWIITPEAKSLTDKIQMQGEPVTLHNIETNVKKSLREPEGEESALVKILLFPFRIIAIIFNGLGKILTPVALFLVEAIRIAAGMFFILLSLALMVALFVLVGSFLGLNYGDGIYGGGARFGIMQFELIRDSITPFMVLVSSVTAFIPLLGFMLMGVAIISRRKIIHTAVGWSLFGIWILSVIGVAATIPGFAMNFSQEADVEVEETFRLDDKTVVLRLTEVGMDDYDGASLQLKGQEASEFRLVKYFEGRGRTRKDAIQNTQAITYNVTLTDSIFSFDSNITFEDNAVFRAQEVEAVFYIPYNRIFVMDEDLKYILRNTLYMYGYNEHHLSNNTWRFTPAGLECITCGTQPERRDRNRNSISSSNGGLTQLFDIENFQKLDISGFYNVQVRQGEEYKVSISGKEKDLENIEVNNEAGALTIRSRDHSTNLFNKNRHTVSVFITMPVLEEFDLSGASTANITGFKGDNMEISLSGASNAKAYLQINHLTLEMSGASNIDLHGEGISLDADLAGLCSLDGYNFKVDQVVVEANGASSAKVYGHKNISYSTSGVSKVNTMGNAEVREN